MTRKQFLYAAGALLAAPEPIAVTVDRKQTIGVSRLSLGITHTRFSLDTAAGVSPGTVTRAKELLGAVCRYHNAHIMGWGTMNPNPAPGVYDWASLDARMALIRSTPGAVPAITLCACPDWMKGGAPNQTDWSKIESAPLPEHHADFAALAAKIAARYPDVRHFQVWNEMKGLWKASANNWDAARYTDLYNHVYDALKAVRPDIQVGGPYLVVEGSGSNGEKKSWATEAPIRARQWETLEFWLRHKRGADFLVLDRGIQDFHDPNRYTLSERLELTRWFGEIVRQVRAHPGAGELPIWFAEYYASSKSDSRAAVAALHASSLTQMARAGASTALLWQPMDSGEVGHALFADIRQSSGPETYPLYEVYRALHTHFGPGTELRAVHTSAPHLEALASRTHILLINQQEMAVPITLNGDSIAPLAPFEVRLIPAAV